MKRFLFYLLIFAALLPSEAAAAGSAPVVDRTVYGRTVHTLRLQLDRDATAPALPARDIQRIQSVLRALKVVMLPGAGMVATDMDRIAGEIDPADRSSVQAVALELDALDSGLSRTSNTGTISADTSGSLASVYRDPRFHPPCSGAACLKEWALDHFGTPIERFLVWLAAHRPGNISLNPAIAILLLVFFTALVAGLGFLLSRGALKRMTVQTRLQSEPPDNPTEETAADLARSASAAGDYRAAFRYLFLSVMLDLQSRGVIQLRPGWTNRDHLRAITGVGTSVAAPLEALVDAFDRVWYGHKDLHREEYERLLAAAHQVQKAQEETAA